MIRYSINASGKWFVDAKDGWIQISEYEFLLPSKSGPYKFGDSNERRDKESFLAFVREHHDADTVEFIEKWIEKREPKPMEPFRSGWFDIEPKDDGVLAFSIGGGCVRLGLDGQQEMADYLTENLKRHGVEVGT